MTAPDRRYVVAWRPRGAGNAWHVVDRRTGATVSRHPDRAEAERSSLATALQRSLEEARP